MNDDRDLLSDASLCLETCRKMGLTISTAESCTAGMISGYLSAISGSSDVLDRGFITYSNQAKQDLLGVLKVDLKQFGAVSDVVARSMAEGGLKEAGTGICIAVTGIAGPGGGSDEKPVGLVYLACACKHRPTLIEKNIYSGNRDDVRRKTVQSALKLIISQAEAFSE